MGLEVLAFKPQKGEEMKALFLALSLMLSGVAVANEKDDGVYVVAVEDDGKGGGTVHLIACEEPISVVLTLEDFRDEAVATGKLLDAIDEACSE